MGHRRMAEGVKAVRHRSRAGGLGPGRPLGSTLRASIAFVILIPLSSATHKALSWVAIPSDILGSPIWWLAAASVATMSFLDLFAALSEGIYRSRLSRIKARREVTERDRVARAPKVPPIRRGTPPREQHLETLGLGRGASDPEIKSAWRKVARQHHPDRSHDASSPALYQSAKEAYEALIKR